MIDNKVKLVIWDLDDTFWRGILTEGGITPIECNREIVLELSKRGIVNSICSKNDYEQTKAKLIELDVWDYFVFPSISFNPKGKAIADMIEAAALRAENVLFIDDNRLNLEEVKFFNPGIMAAHPDDVLGGLLDHAHLEGKPDPEFKRLKQYQFLQRKVEEKSASALSNEEFLRSCNIVLTIDHDIESNFDRVVELINRTNQLNYTKKRLETPESLEKFRKLLSSFGYYAGCVRATDRYGDYGLVGFFLMQRRAAIKKLVHLVFSCRTMNMGIEQYIYEMLGSPEIDIEHPVSYGLKTHEVIDWITLDNQVRRDTRDSSGQKLVLIGGCDLLQLASYCSSSRLEFVNRVEDDVRVRFDDPGFIISEREAIRACEALSAVPNWTYKEAISFDEGIASSELILLSMWPAMSGQYFHVGDSVLVRLTKEQQEYLEARKPGVFSSDFRPLTLNKRGRQNLVRKAFGTIAKKSLAGGHIFILGCYTKGDARARRRSSFNEMCRTYCERRSGKFRYVDIDAIVPPDSLVDKVHFTRAGYLAIAKHIMDMSVSVLAHESRGEADSLAGEVGCPPW